MSRKLAVTYRPSAGLVPYDRNARTHSDGQVDQIVASIKEFGFTNPILVDGENGVIAGHGRLLAAKKMGLEKVPVILLADLTDAQRRAYVLADNKLGLNAGWDDALLALELTDLKALSFDLGLTGFSAGEVEELFGKAAAKAGLTDPDDAPEPPVDPVSRLGDVWLLGRHRITCGDCTDAAVVERVLAGARPHLMVTDPPYGVSYDANWRNEPEKLNLKSTTALGGVRNATTGKVLNDDRSDWSDAWALFPGDVVYCWHGERQGPDLVGHFRAFNFEPRNLIVWAKDGLVISRGHYHPQHEGCWYFVRKGATGHWGGDRKQSTLWEIAKNRKNETGHSTQKPIECMRRPIENNSKAGDAVYEPFSGSGTTIIAAEMTGRRCFAIELNPAYVDVAVKRWEAFAGETATLEGDGRTFAEISADAQRP